MLSICIPTYNRSDYLDITLDSIQTCLASSIRKIDIEIVVSDNNSSDATEGIVYKYAKILPIVFSQNRINVGASANLRKSSELAQGDFLWFLGDDDVLIKGSIEYLLEFIRSHPDVSYVFYPRILVNHDLSSSKHGDQPSGIKEDVIFQSGKDLFTGLSGQMPSILGFFSSTIIERQKWNDSCQIPENLVGEFGYLKTILHAIADKKSAVLGKPGVLCRLQNSRPFSINSKVWLDQYVDAFLYAKLLGYPHEQCDMEITSLIKNFSKAFVIDKSIGARHGHIPGALSKLGVKRNRNHFSLWYFISFLPKDLCRIIIYTALKLKKWRSAVSK